MIVKLAGYNVEADLLRDPGVVNRNVSTILTPETFSAAYARISRSAKDIISLRRDARKDVETARKSNRAIIFEMGHHSVAEHAVFNFDIIGVSRLALEEIEQFRLVSYTEKSQRYVTLKGDYVLPAEIKDCELQQLFKETVTLQNDFYSRTFNILEEYTFNKHPHMAGTHTGRNTLKGWAKEDARYILSLATEGQVGMTINARNLEHLFRKFHLSRWNEVREIGARMHEQVVQIAPSIFLFSQPSQFSQDLKHTFKDNFTSIPAGEKLPDRALQLLHYTENGDDIILASFLSTFHAQDYTWSLDVIKNMGTTEKERIYKNLFKNIEFFDTMPREFEMVDIAFQAVISASNFAQLKRHRIATLLPGNYDIRFGCVIPESIKVNGLEKEFLEIIDKTNNVHLKLKEIYGDAADYILTNSHCRKVIMKMNLREVYHFIRLRDDDHAQWEIRELAHQLLQQIKPLMPLATMMLCGKSDFVNRFECIYQQKPKLIIASGGQKPF
ncbi:MAG TPA: FAD-dependent thymidylate synthase [Candidatus Kapabacteria bacterium]|nr:FAD-dependent thymidylate synthase [Candidatus Kapabacteria bacterium]